MRLFYFCLLLWASPVTGANTEIPIRFGLTAVVVTENLRFLDQWSHYLEGKMGRKIEFILRKSYREVMDLMESGSIDFAWICGYPYVQKGSTDFLQLLTVPIYRGAPYYYSYIIVPGHSPYKHFSDLKGKSFAFSDPDSNSGFLYPLSLLADKGFNAENYFRLSFFTFNHAETIQAVAEQVADGGAVDSYIWEYLAIFRPDITEKTRIIDISPKFGFPPIVSRTGVDPQVTRLMKESLQTMDQDSMGKKLLERLKLDGFAHHSDALFNNIRTMALKVQKTDQNYPLIPIE